MWGAGGGPDRRWAEGHQEARTPGDGMGEGEQVGLPKPLRELLDPRETSSAHFTGFYLRAICLVVLAGFAIMLCVLIPVWWLTETFYRVMGAVWPVVLGGG